jgi:hypothetical protein
MHTLPVAEVDPDDDAVDRWIVHWYRYDPTRRERRNTVVAAFDNELEFLLCVGETHAELQRLQAEGRAERVERISGGVKRAGTTAESRARRAASRGFLRRPR